MVAVLQVHNTFDTGSELPSVGVDRQRDQVGNSDILKPPTQGVSRGALIEELMESPPSRRGLESSRSGCVGCQ